MKHLITAFILSLCTIAASAEATHEVMLLNVGSVHSSAGFNNVNPGTGVQFADSQGNGYSVGSYFNSDRKMTAYAGYVATYRINNTVSISALTGVASGYKNGLVAIVLPSLALRLSDKVSLRLSYAAKVTDYGSQALHLSFDYFM